MLASNSSAETRLLRPLGAIEKLFWLMDQNHPMHFLLVGEVLGQTQVTAWQEGLDALCRQSDLIWSRILSNDSSGPFFQAAAVGSIPLQVIRHSPTDWTAAAAAQLAQPFFASQPPLVRATLLYGIERSTIILAAHHSIADGLSLTYLLRDLLRTVAGAAVTMKRESDNLEILVERTFREAGAQVSPSLPAGHSTTRETTPYRRQDGSVPHMEPLHLTRAATTQLRDRARAEDCSIHGALCAAFISARSELAPVQPGQPLRVSSPVDIRRRLLDHSEHFGMCICGVVVEDKPAETGFWDKARYFSNSLASIKTAEGMASLVFAAQRGIAPLTSVSQAANLAAQLFAGEIDLSNLGVIRIPETYGSLRLQNVWGPSVTLGFLPEQSVGAVTFGDRLHLLHMSYAPIRGLLSRAVELLAGSVVEVRHTARA